jgi:hypothetical protein
VTATDQESYEVIAPVLDDISRLINEFPIYENSITRQVCAKVGGWGH